MAVGGPPAPLPQYSSPEQTAAAAPCLRAGRRSGTSGKQYFLGAGDNAWPILGGQGTPRGPEWPRGRRGQAGQFGRRGCAIKRGGSAAAAAVAAATAGLVAYDRQRTCLTLKVARAPPPCTHLVLVEQQQQQSCPTHSAPKGAVPPALRPPCAPGTAGWWAGGTPRIAPAAYG